MVSLWLIDKPSSKPIMTTNNYDNWEPVGNKSAKMGTQTCKTTMGPSEWWIIQTKPKQSEGPNSKCKYTWAILQNWSKWKSQTSADTVLWVAWIHVQSTLTMTRSSGWPQLKQQETDTNEHQPDQLQHSTCYYTIGCTHSSQKHQTLHQHPTPGKLR